jgi:signal transduction histidine kinase
MLGMLGFALLWAGLGLSDILPLQRKAVAESGPGHLQNMPLSLISKEQATLLQSTVDSAALSLSGVITADPPARADSADAISPVASALSALTFGLGGDIYFTAWEDTRILHSPLAPDAEGMDFADAIDGHGIAFVLGMAHAAISGGGFLTVNLPRQLSGVAHKEVVDQIVYVRHIPRTRWHIAAFMPAESPPAQGFSLLWSTGRDKGRERFEADYRKGLSISGFSLAGLAGLMLVPGARIRREEESHPPQQKYA